MPLSTSVLCDQQSDEISQKRFYSRQKSANYHKEYFSRVKEDGNKYELPSFRD